MKFEHISICPLYSYEADSDFELENHIHQNHSFILRKTEEDETEGLFIKDFIKLKYYNLVYVLNLLSQVRYG